MKCSSNETTTDPVGRGSHADAVGARPDAPSKRSPGRPSTRRAWRGAAVLGVALSASLSALQPAYAETRSFTDRAGDSGLPADITTVRVSNGPDLVEVAIRPGRVEFGDYFTFWLDTRPKDPGPEYKVGVLPNSDGLGMTRVGAFGQRGTPVPCDDLRGTADHFAPAWVSISVPWSCLGDPGKVRVAVKARYVDGDGGIVDWAPAKRRFVGWVAPELSPGPTGASAGRAG